MSRTRILRERVALVLLATGLVAGCGGEGGGINPVSAPAEEPPPPDAGLPPDPGDAGPAKRTVMTRNLVGEPAENLLADGDFELSTTSAPGSQVGWRAFANAGERHIKTETGGLCRSGLRCAVLAPNYVYLVRGTAANEGAGHVAALAARLPEGASCNAVSALLVECDTFDVLKKLSNDPEPDASGWCEYGATLGKSDTSLCMYIQTTLKGAERGLVDAAVLVPDDGSFAKRSAEFWMPSPDQRAHMLEVREIIRRTRRFDAPPLPSQGVAGRVD